MAGKTIIEMPAEVQAEMLAKLRAARFGYLLAIHILLLCGQGHTPTEIAAYLFCSRTSVYRVVAAYQEGKLDDLSDSENALGLGRARCLAPTIKRSLLALVKKSPQLFGWCRTRWSCAALALELKARRGLQVSAETVRRWLHQCDYVWKRAKLRGKDDDCERTPRLARIRSVIERLKPHEAFFFADELDINLLAKVGYQWMLRGTQIEVDTPGKNEKCYLAGALNFVTGKIIHCLWHRKTSGLFIDLLKTIDQTCPVAKFTKVYVVVDNYGVHKAKVVAKWLAAHPRFELLYLPAYCPKANPIERAFGDVHDKCTRNHKRKRLRDLVADVKRHLKFNGPWKYQISQIYYEDAVTKEVQKLTQSHQLKAA